MILYIWLEINSEIEKRLIKIQQISLRKLTKHLIQCGWAEQYRYLCFSYEFDSIKIHKVAGVAARCHSGATLMFNRQSFVME